MCAALSETISVNFALCYYAGNSDTGYQPKNQPGYQLVSPYQLVTSIKAGYQLVNQAGSFVVHGADPTMAVIIPRLELGYNRSLYLYDC